MSRNLGWDLYCAAEKGQIKVVRKLLENGADINYQHPWWRQKNVPEGWGPPTPLIIASNNGHFQVVKYLVEKGANPDLRNNLGETALDLAKKKGHFLIVKILKKEKLISAKLLSMKSGTVVVEIQVDVKYKFQIKLVEKGSKTPIATKSVKTNKAIVFQNLKPKTSYSLVEIGHGIKLLDFSTISSVGMEIEDLSFSSVSVKLSWDYFQKEKTHVRFKFTQEEKKQIPNKIEWADESIVYLKFYGLTSGKKYELLIIIEDERFGSIAEQKIDFTTNYINLDIFEFFLQKSAQYQKTKKILILQTNILLIQSQIKKYQIFQRETENKLADIKNNLYNLHNENIKTFKESSQINFNLNINDEKKIIDYCTDWIQIHEKNSISLNPILNIISNCENENNYSTTEEEIKELPELLKYSQLQKKKEQLIINYENLTIILEELIHCCQNSIEFTKTDKFNNLFQKFEYSLYNSQNANENLTIIKNLTKKVNLLIDKSMKENNQILEIQKCNEQIIKYKNHIKTIFEKEKKNETINLIFGLLKNDQDFKIKLEEIESKWKQFFKLKKELLQDILKIEFKKIMDFKANFQINISSFSKTVNKQKQINKLDDQKLLQKIKKIQELEKELTLQLTFIEDLINLSKSWNGIEKWIPKGAQNQSKTNQRKINQKTQFVRLKSYQESSFDPKKPLKIFTKNQMKINELKDLFRIKILQVVAKLEKKNDNYKKIKEDNGGNIEVGKEGEGENNENVKEKNEKESENETDMNEKKEEYQNEYMLCESLLDQNRQLFEKFPFLTTSLIERKKNQIIYYIENILKLFNKNIILSNIKSQEKFIENQFSKLKQLKLTNYEKEKIKIQLKKKYFTISHLAEGGDEDKDKDKDKDKDNVEDKKRKELSNELEKIKNEIRIIKRKIESKLINIKKNCLNYFPDKLIPIFESNILNFQKKSELKLWWNDFNGMMTNRSLQKDYQILPQLKKKEKLSKMFKAKLKSNLKKDSILILKEIPFDLVEKHFER
ncbi:ankyrin repeat [Anaeramoeba flamelloides]|uniref:Ankyrin repeat n=1 Tax=Anaeramoeba flamelloides TaxID=1746091 RepID=A0ABQ8XZE2_9EUKA|nr:ankyrin repeat [Anaeramoeba flamelloides]